MLHIILGILKIIGMILLICMLLLLLFLFVPVRYRLAGKRSSEVMEGWVRVTWLWRLFIFKAEIKEGVIVAGFRICGFYKQLYPSVLKVPKPKKRSKTRNSEKSDEEVERDQSLTEKCLTKEPENDSKSHQSNQENQSEEKGRSDEEQQSEEKGCSDEEQQSEEKRRSEEEQQSEEKRRSDEEQQSEEQRRSGEEQQSEEQRCSDEEQRSNVKQQSDQEPKSSEKQRSGTEQPQQAYHQGDTSGKQKNFISRFLENIKEIFSNGKKVKEKAAFYLDLLAGDTTRRIYHRYREMLQYLWRHTHPRKVNGEIYYGLGDPSLTGQAAGILYILLPVGCRNLKLHPDFYQILLEGEINIRGRIRMIHLVNIGWKIFRDKELRAWMKQWIK